MKKLFTLLTAIIASTAMAFAGDTYIITGDYNNWSLTNNCITFTEEDGGYVATADEFKTGPYGFKIARNPDTESWEGLFGIADPIATDTENTLVLGGDNIYLGYANNDVTLHNVKFEFYPASDGSLDYFKITADEKVAIDKTVVDSYMMVGTWQGWKCEDEYNPLKFEYQGDGVYTASIDEIFGDWKIVKNNSWSGALGGAGTDMQPGNVYNLTKGGENTGFATGNVLKNAKFTLTILEDGNATLKVEGTMGEEHSFSLVGEFQGWKSDGGPFLTQQEDGSWTVDVKDFPGGKAFKISIDKTWTCFLAPDAATALTFGEAFTCARGDNSNNLSIGESGTNYDIHVMLVVADDAQSATLTITGTATGIDKVNADNAKTVIYSISGQKLSELQKGINIVNGKKVIVK